MSPLVEAFCEILHEHRRWSLPLVEKLLDAGFPVEARRAGAKPYAIAANLADLADDPQAVCRNLNEYTRERGGELAVLYGEQVLVRIAYGEDWRADVQLEMFAARDLDLPGMQRALVGAFDHEDLEHMIDVTAEFLAAVAGRPYGYELAMRGTPFLSAKLEGRTLRVKLLDVPAYLQMMLFFMAKSETAMLVRSAVDVVKLAEQAQDTLRYMADAYEEKEITVVIDLGGQAVFRCGHGVRPNLGSRFGATALHLELLVKMFRTRPRRD